MGQLLEHYEKTQLQAQLEASLWKLAEERPFVVVQDPMDLMPHLTRGHLPQSREDQQVVLKRVTADVVYILCPCLSPLVFKRCTVYGCEEPIMERTPFSVCGLHRE
jgi:hypothetical protein